LPQGVPKPKGNAAISLPLRKQGQDETQRHLKVINSIRTFYEAVKDDCLKQEKTRDEIR
jgi:hypothetical protein